MATYYGTYGQKVQYLASDPSDPQIGQVWYNSTSAVLKVRQVGTVNAWATGGNLNQARGDGAATGTQSAALYISGSSYPTFYTNTEKYGRILADVYIDGINLNELLMKEKYAVSYDGGTKKKPASWLKYRLTGDL